MRSRTTDPSPARISALWFGVQLTWGAILGLALQARCTQFGGASALSLFAIVATSGAVAAAITQLAVGPWSDRVVRAGGSRRGFYLTGILAGSVATIAFFIAPSAIALTATFVALQIALNVAIGPYQAVVPDTLDDGRIAGGSAWIAAMQSAGNAIGAVFASLFGASLLLGAVLAFSMLATAAITLVHLRGRAPMRNAAASFALRAIFADLFISRALVYLGFYTLVGYLYFFVRTFEPANATRASGIAILIFTFVGSAGAVLAARAASRTDERLVVFAGAGFMALSLAALATLHTFALVVAAIVAAGVGWGVFLCADWTIACRILPRNALAGTMALWNLAVLAPQIAAPALASAVLAMTGTLHGSSGPSFAIGLAASEMFTGAMWIWRLPRKQVGK